MGVRHLDTYIRETVPGGFIRINIEDEIRMYFQKAGKTNPKPPIIVIDLITLYTPLSKYDRKGLYFGGRFNLAYTVIDELFGKLKGLGAKLVFFYDGPVPESKNETWCARQDRRYEEMLPLISAVDMGFDLTALMNYSPPLNFRYALKFIAKKYGELKVTMTHECDQELAAHATKVNALAIISNDSDFLIYEGSWKYWSSREIQLPTLVTMEYNRAALVRHLDLSFQQMPLLATLSGNDIMPFDVVKLLHYQLGYGDEFPKLARYIKALGNGPLNEVAIRNVLSTFTNSSTWFQQFQQSLNTYSVNINPQDGSTTGDLVQEALSKQESAFMYLLWLEKRLDVSIGLVDMRERDFGQDYGQLQISLIVRMAGIILFHRKPRQPTQCSIIIKTTHYEPHQAHSYPVVYPRDIETPTLLDLLSKDPVVLEDFQTVKYQLLAWIASDTLNPDKLREVPPQLRITVFSVYYLLDQKVLELFEADLLLQVAYDVAFETYDPKAVDYPRKIESRPFRLVFLYQTIYGLATKAYRLVGLDDENFRDDPPFDGVLFHKRYDDWSKGRCELEQIEEWRIYEELATQGSKLEKKRLV
nr:uncharacterized protein LOC109410481 [Aedes albopictus]